MNIKICRRGLTGKFCIFFNLVLSEKETSFWPPSIACISIIIFYITWYYLSYLLWWKRITVNLSFQIFKPPSCFSSYSKKLTEGALGSELDLSLTTFIWTHFTILLPCCWGLLFLQQRAQLDKTDKAIVKPDITIAMEIWTAFRATEWINTLIFTI